MNLHIILEYLAFFIGVRFYYFKKRKSKDTISNLNRLWILLGAMIGALIGSRLIGVMEVKDFYANFSFSIIKNNKTVLGGLFGGLFGVELVKKIIKERASSGDLYVLPIILALFIGRIGCFSMGVYEPTFGIETTFFTGLNLGDGLYRHPIMLYEMAFLFFIFIYFSYSINHRKSNYENGNDFKIFMILYFSFRFIFEFLKPYYPIFLNFSIIHWCGIFIYIYYYKFILRLIKYNN